MRDYVLAASDKRKMAETQTGANEHARHGKDPVPAPAVSPHMNGDRTDRSQLRDTRELEPSECRLEYWPRWTNAQILYKAASTVPFTTTCLPS